MLAPLSTGCSGDVRQLPNIGIGSDRERERIVRGMFP